MRKHRFSFSWLAGLLLLHCTASAGELVEPQKLPEQRPTLALQIGHSGPVTCVAFSPDGKLVLTGSGDSTVRMWDAASGREIRAFRHRGGVTSVAFSPDGKRVLACGTLFRNRRQGSMQIGESGEGAVVLWDAASGREIQSFKHPQGASSVALSPDGTQVLTGSHDLDGRPATLNSGAPIKGVARLWDAASGREIRAFRPRGDVKCVAFSPDGKQVLTGGETVRLWDTQSGEELRTLLELSQSGYSNSGDSVWVSSLAFSPDGKQVLIGTSKMYTYRPPPSVSNIPSPPDPFARPLRQGSRSDARTSEPKLSDASAKAVLRDVASGREIQAFKDRVADVYSAAFLPDGKRVLLGGPGSTQLWDVARGKLIRAFPGSGGSAALSSDGKQVLTEEGPVALLWAVESTRIRTYDGHTARISCVAISPDGTRVLTGSLDKTARLWDAASHKELRAFPHHGFVDKVAFSPDGKQVLTGSGRPPEQGSQRVLSGDPNNFAQGYGQFSRVPRGQRQFGRDPDNAAWLWDAAGGKLLHTFPAKAVVRCVAFSPDGRRVLVGDEQADNLWDAASGKRIRNIGRGDAKAIAFSPDGKQVFIANSRGPTGPMARLFDAADGSEIRAFLGHGSAGVNAAAFSPDGKQVLTGSYDATARLWDAASGTEIRRFLGHTHGISSVAFSADGMQVLTASDDKTARWWDAASGKEIRVFHGKELPWSVAFSPDGKQLITASGDQVQSWDAAADGKELPGELRRFTGLASAVTAVAFSPDAKQVVTVSGKPHSDWDVGRHGGSLQRVHVWNPADIKVISSFSVGEGTSVAFSPNGKYLVTVSPVPPPPPVLYAPDKPRVLVSFGEPHVTVGLWDPASGKETPAFSAAKPINCVAYSPDGKQMVTVTSVYQEVSEVDQYRRPLVWKKRSDTARLWDASSGEEIRTFDLTLTEEDRPAKMLVNSVVFSGDGQRVLMVGVSGPDDRRNGELGDEFSNGRVGVWNVASGEKIETVFRPEARTYAEARGFKYPLSRLASMSMAISPDGRQVLTGIGDQTARLWDLATGKELQKFAGHDSWILSLGFSPDGKQVLTRRGGRAHLWDAASGKEIHEFPFDATFAPGSQQLLTTESNYQVSESGKLITARLWDAASGKEIHALQGHTDWVNCVDFSRDGKQLLTGSADGTARIWDTASGQEVGRLLAFADDTWAAMTPDNYYTASKGALKNVAFRVGTQVFPFDQFDLKFNRPDKVLESFGLASEKLIAGYRHAYQKRLKQMNLTEQMLGDDFHLPTVALPTDLPLATRQKSITLKLKAHDAKYLLDRLNVYVNGVPLDGSAGIVVRDKKTSGWEQTVDIELSRGPNRIELSAINEKGAESLRESFDINCDAPPAKPDLYVVVVGVSAYQDARYRLTYADKDANDLADYLQTRKENFNQVHLVRLVNQDATRDKILEAKQLLRQSKVDDQVIVYFAGHGLLDDKLDYYFATVDVGFRNPSAKGLSYEAIEDLVGGIRARKKLLLMDTCHSGEVDKEETKAAVAERFVEGEVKGRTVRGLMREKPLGMKNSLRVQQELFADLRRGSGAVVISAAGGMEFALESPDWKNGVFTYALLRGLKDMQADRNKDNRIQVSELRDYIMDEVRRLTRDLQSPTIRMENLEFDYTLD